MEVRTAGHFIHINRNQRLCIIAVLAHAWHVLSGCRCKFHISTDQQFRIWLRLRSDRNVVHECIRSIETGFERATLACRSWLYAFTGVGLEYDFHTITPWEIDGAQIMWMRIRTRHFFSLPFHEWIATPTNSIYHFTFGFHMTQAQTHTHTYETRTRCRDIHFVNSNPSTTYSAPHQRMYWFCISLACHSIRDTHRLNEPENQFNFMHIENVCAPNDAYPYLNRWTNDIHDAMVNSNRNNNNKRQSNVVWALIKYYFVFLLTHRTLNGISTPSIPMWRRTIHATASAMCTDGNAWVWMLCGRVTSNATCRCPTNDFIEFLLHISFYFLFRAS